MDKETVLDYLRSLIKEEYLQDWFNDHCPGLENVLQMVSSEKSVPVEYRSYGWRVVVFPIAEFHSISGLDHMLVAPDDAVDARNAGNDLWYSELFR